MTILEFFGTFYKSRAKRIKRNEKINAYYKNLMLRRFYSLYTEYSVAFSLYVAHIINTDNLTDKQKIETILKKLNERL